MSEGHSAQETAKAHAAFMKYCSLGSGRSLPKLAQELGKTSGYTRCLETWSSAYQWQERVKHYDKERAEERRKQDEEAVRDMFLKHIQAEVEPTAASQVRAGQIFVEQMKIADELAAVKEELQAIDELLRQAGLKA